MKATRFMSSFVLGHSLCLMAQSALPTSTTPSMLFPYSQDFILVSGSSNISIPPDSAQFSISVRSTGQAVGETVVANRQKVERVLVVLKAGGVKQEDIQTSEFEIVPIEGKISINGYRVSNRITITLKSMSGIGNLLQAGIEAGANEIQGPRFSVSDEHAHQDKGFELAFEDARSKAQNLSKLAGRRLGRVLSISDKSTSPFEFAAPSFGIDSRTGFLGAIPIEMGVQTIRFGVTIAFKLD